jgi:hypothetical protein
MSSTAPPKFQSQFEKFSTTGSNERLKSSGGSTTAPSRSGSDEKFKPVQNDDPSYSTGDRDQHWQSLIESPGVPMYISGRYIESDHGRHKIESKKEYEYELSARALPVSVGDVLRVPVHPTGHKGGKDYKTVYLKMQVTDIYTKKKFHEYHDRVEG